jgi:type IV secretory pathway TraG/TraD family ATPase VirD4
MANVNFILDEAASLSANMSSVEDAVDKLRGYGVRLFLFYQTPAQLETCFPKGQGQTVLANTTQIYFAINDNAVAQLVSNRLGDATIVVESGGSGSSHSRSAASIGTQDNASVSSNTNTNWGQAARTLLKPAEIMTLDERIAITFVQGMPPIATVLERYYERKRPDDRWRPVFTLIQSTGVFLVGSLCLFLTFASWEQINHAGSQSRSSRSGRSSRIGGDSIPGRGARGESVDHAGTDGTGKRDIQWQRVRPLRAGTIHPESRKFEGNSGAGTDARERVDGP